MDREDWLPSSTLPLWAASLQSALSAAEKMRQVNLGWNPPPSSRLYKESAPLGAGFGHTRPLLQGGLAASLSHLGAHPPNGRADCSLCYHAYAMSRSDTAGAMGGALVGRPRQVKILWIASGESMAASILIRPPQRGQERTSTSNTRAMSVAHG